MQNLFVTSKEVHSQDSNDILSDEVAILWYIPTLSYSSEAQLFAGLTQKMAHSLLVTEQPKCKKTGKGQSDGYCDKRTSKTVIG